MNAKTRHSEEKLAEIKNKASKEIEDFYGRRAEKQKKDSAENRHLIPLAR